MDLVGVQQGGFNFDLAERNKMLMKAGFAPHSAMKTGTTIVGVVYKDGVVLGADTRATSGAVVCDKNCEKIHYIAPNIYCCGAGTSADTENSTAMISSELELHRLNTGKSSRVVTAMTLLKRMLFKYQGNVSAALVLGGVDETGPHLYSIYPHGSTDKLPYATMGSGSLAAMGVFEANYRPNMELEDAKRMVHQAVLAGVFNDLASGNNVDLCVLTKDKVEMLRNYDVANPRQHKKYIHFPRGTAPVWRDLTQVVAVQDVEMAAAI
eukprot:c12559_g1_i2.p1 GENE.c12559_g1_i2~~c12559_g1_i2.p1  ORF type:complete len:274 (-),score=84.53 c12559_g1_i2:118-915(-)